MNYTFLSIQIQESVCRHRIYHDVYHTNSTIKSKKMQKIFPMSMLHSRAIKTKQPIVSEIIVEAIKVVTTYVKR